MQIKNHIFGVDIDFDSEGEIAFRFMVEDDGTWYTEEDTFRVEIIPRIISVLKQVESHLKAKKMSAKVFAADDVTAELIDAKSKVNKHAFIVHLRLNAQEIEAMRFSEGWNSIVLELMENAKAYCESLGLDFNARQQTPDTHQ